MIEERYRTFWRRFLAGWVDAIVFCPLSFAAFWVLHHHSAIPVAVLIAWHTTFSVSWYVYSIWFHGRFGQTIGKMLLGLKVLDASETTRIRYSQALRRDIIPLGLTVALLPHELLKIAAGTFYVYAELDKFSLAMTFVMTGWSFLEVVTMLFSKKRRAIHDFIAGSVVIRTAPTKPSNATSEPAPDAASESIQG